MHLKCFLICLFTGLSLYQVTLSAEDGFLLKSPPAIDSEALDEKIVSLSMPMTWRSTSKITGDSWLLGFDHKNGKTFLKLQFIKNLPNNLTQSEQSQFAKAREGNLDIWTYTHGSSPQILETKPKIPPTLQEAMGMLAEPLLVEEESRYPQPITVTGLTHKIQDQKVVFYTGAGISAEVVPTMPDLMKSLGLPLKEERAVLALIQNILAHPASYAAVMDKFYQACYYGKPTAAHMALRDLVTLKNWGLLTENLDFLHQRSGIDPLTHSTPNWLKSTVSEDDLKAIDMVITVGLQSDESGFLGWYKKHNPNGKIAAINLRSPNYLGTQDYFLQGDAQVLVPELYEVLR